MPPWAAQIEQDLLAGRSTPAGYFLAQPGGIFRDAGYEPDAWQESVLQSNARQLILLCSRQTGKTTSAIALLLLTMIVRAPALVLVLSPSDRQSGEIVRRAKQHYRALGHPIPVVGESALQLHLANGSRLIGLPESERTIRVYSGVQLLLIDEAARVDEALYNAVRPMLAVSRGRLIALSTPFGQRGWFYDAWHTGEGWERHKITAHHCPRISREFLESERRSMPQREFEQEYECVFQEAEGSVFREVDIEAAFATNRPPLEL